MVVPGRLLSLRENQSAAMGQPLSPGSEIVPAKRQSRSIHVGPEVHGVQLFTAAGLEVAEELSPVGRVSVENKVYQQRPEGGFSAEHIDFTSEIGFGPFAQEAGAFAGLLLHGGDGLIKAHR